LVKRQSGHLNYIQATLNEEDTVENLNDFWEKWQGDNRVTGGELEQLQNGTWQVNVIANDVYASNSKIPYAQTKPDYDNIVQALENIDEAPQ